MPRSHPISDYRNFGIMAHIDAGKTPTHQTQTVTLQDYKYMCPPIFLTNKMNTIAATFFKYHDNIITPLNHKPVTIQLPIRAEQQFNTIIDLVPIINVVCDEDTLDAKY